MRLRKLKPWETKYRTAHPGSEMGDPNVADRDGYELVAVRPDGLLIYRRKPWWAW
jgi:hypothetical protein